MAAELGLTQSGVSQALRRLRDIFGDELFLRRPHGMEPTSVALLLEPQITAAVGALREALGGARPFDPATADGVLRLSALDAEQAALLPRLLVFLRAEAPGMQLSVVTLPRPEVPEALATGRIDLALGYYPSAGSQVLAERLYDQGYLVAGGAETMAGGPMTLARYLAKDHVLVSSLGDMRGIVDTALETLGRSRRVVMSVPLFYAAMAAVAATDTIATLPEHLARAHATGMGLTLADPPLPLRRFTISVLRHRRNAADPRLVWAMGLVRKAASEIGQVGG